MPRDANGVYSLPPAYLAVTGSTITALQHNSPLEDLASAITASLPRNGAAPFQGVLRINNNAPTIALQDTDGRTGFLHVNGSIFYLMRGAINGTIWDGGPDGHHPLTINLETGTTVLAGSLTSYGNLTIQNTAPSLALADIDAAARYVQNNGGFVGFLGSDANWKLNVTDSGAVWTAQLGDLSARIEDRAAAHAASAAASRILRTGDTMSGNLTIQNTAPSLILADTDAVARYVQNNGGFVGFLGSDTNWKLRADDSGAVWTGQWGDLSTRIESRAAAYASERVAKTGDTMTGNLMISRSFPYVSYYWAGVKHSRTVVDDTGNFAIQDGDTGQNHFVVSGAGAVWTQQFGDLSARIESRADSWSVARREEAKTWSYANLVGNLRYAGGGDFTLSPGNWAGINAGDTITGLHWSGTGTAGLVDAVRIRVLQALMNGTWFTISTS